jgi:tRNA (mo5U34)-methyltransferase
MWKSVMDKQEIIQNINDLGNWFYQFDLKGNLTPVHPKFRINRHQQRKQYIFEPLIQLCGGSLVGKRVLDLGCNSGFWSLACIEIGADFVLGIDARKLHIDQAKFVFEVKEIPKNKYQFIQGDIFKFNFKDFGNFDIVLCLGLLYHISKPISLLEIISKINNDILIIDTNLSHLPGSFLEIRQDDLDHSLSAINFPLVTYPTKLALIKMVHQFGYSIAILKPRFQNYVGANDYKYRARRAFLCGRKMDLTKIKMETESVTPCTQCADFMIWVLRSFLYSSFSRWIVRRLPEKWTSPIKRALR